jgi:hypothetical protein
VFILEWLQVQQLLEGWDINITDALVAKWRKVQDERAVSATKEKMALIQVWAMIMLRKGPTEAF